MSAASLTFPTIKSTCTFIPQIALFLCFLMLPVQAHGEIDPERRTNLEVGGAGPLNSSGPLGGYGMLLINRPHFRDPDTYVLAIVSPYLFGEAIRDKWPSEGHAVGFSLGGGFLANNFDQIRNGRFQRSESFRGDGGDAALSYYLRPPPIAGELPVDGILRFGTRYALYQRGSATDPDFRLPADTFIHTARVGIRVGGVPPELLPEKALELSLWHEVDYRVKTGTYGLPGRVRETEHLTQQSWARLGGIMPTWGNQSASVMISAGTSGKSDELSCYRMGSGLRFQNEFPYILHGYYFQEVFARSFFLLNTSYRLTPIPDIKRLQLQLNYDYALVRYLSGHELPRNSLNGLGLDLILLLKNGITLTVGYGFGADALRRGRFDGHQLNMMFEWKM
ncbi:hypothetical protein [Geotalea sp. SG265]|uniref:hypothetical protein n=1 Tax=Geotalea sp. SG265 TaxID=2922867 RepID=UPI001FAEACF2|nr:hypothetical protein [Geotalea sp. SG265]